MKSTYSLIVSVLMAHMLITSVAGRDKKCSKECKEFVENKIDLLEARLQAQTKELNELKNDSQAQTEELNALKSDNQELQSALESLNKTVTQLQDQLTGALTESSILGGLDSKYLDQLNSFLVPVLQSSSRSSFVRCWHAKTDGWAASTFHSNCDGKGPTVTIIQVDKYIFGGYTDASWSGPSPDSCGPASSNKSFIFSLYNINGYAPVKLQIKSSTTCCAIYTCFDHGPEFGVGDIHISNNAGSNRKSITHCDLVYPLPPGYSSSFSYCKFYAGSYEFTPTDVEVFYESTT